MAARRTTQGVPSAGREAPLTPRLAGVRAAALLVTLLVVTFAAYQPAWHGGQLWDDNGHITRPELRSVEGLRRIWIEPGATQQVLSAAAFDVLADAPAGRRHHHRVSPAQHRPARRCGVAVRPPAGAPGCSVAVAGRVRVRAASRPCRVCRVDHRAEEHALGRVVPGSGARLSPVRPAPPPVGVGACGGALRAGAAQQDRHGDVAGAPSGGDLAATRAAGRPTRSGAARPAHRRRRGLRPADGLGRTHVHRRARPGLRALDRRAHAGCGPRRVVLSRHARLAGEPHLHLPEVDD